MRSELEKYGIQMPAFSKIGGILANEMTVDDAALHAVIIAINEAIDNKNSEETMTALQNPSALLTQLHGESAEKYQTLLFAAKETKAEAARNRSLDKNLEHDVYDEYLTQAEIQGNVNKINTVEALVRVDDALSRKDKDLLLQLLKSHDLGIYNVKDENIDFYIVHLDEARDNKMFLYMLYEDFTLNHQGQIFSTQEKRIHQKLCISKLNAKIQKTIDKMIKAGQKASEAFIIDICNEVLGNVFDIIEASNSIADISNGFVTKIFEEFKAVGLDRYIRSLTDAIFHACTDDHIGPERHKSKNTKLRNNEHIQHEPLEALDLVGEIRQRSKSLLEVVSRITLTLLRLGLQVLKRSSYLWSSDNDLILPKIREVPNENLDLQRPLQSNSYMKRMSTFKFRNNAKGVIWNEEQIVKPEQLVAAGFSFDGKQDHVRCTSCECTSDVSKWNRNDDEYALSIHKGLAKDCIFVRTYGGSCMPEHVLPD